MNVSEVLSRLLGLDLGSFAPEMQLSVCAVFLLLVVCFVYDLLMMVFGYIGGKRR